jgi:hypothetical protein
MIKRFNSETYPEFSRIIDEIEATLNCTKFQIFSDVIEIDTWENIKGKMPRNRKLAESGFGFCITNFYEFGEFVRIIVINLENCNLAQFTNREIAAIILHELGHLLNEPEFIQKPTFLYCFNNGIVFNQKILDEITSEVNMKKEIYADSYANQYGFGEELITTFHKQNLHFEQKIGYLNERVQSLKSKEFFNGNVVENKETL